MNQFYPRSYELTDLKEANEFKEDYRCTRAEVVLKKYARKKVVKHVQKLLIAIDVSEKRMRDVNDYLDIQEDNDDDEEEGGLVPDRVWRFLDKDSADP